MWAYRLCTNNFLNLKSYALSCINQLFNKKINLVGVYSVLIRCGSGDVCMYASHFYWLYISWKIQLNNWGTDHGGVGAICNYAWCSFHHRSSSPQCETAWKQTCLRDQSDLRDILHRLDFFSSFVYSLSLLVSQTINRLGKHYCCCGITFVLFINPSIFHGLFIC